MMSESISELNSSYSASEPVDLSVDELQGSYLSLFYATLFHPLRAFKAISVNQPNSRLLFFAILSVVLVSALTPLVHLATQGGNPSSLIWTMPLSAVSGVMIWAFMGVLIGLLAYAFTGKSRIGTFYTLSGLATLPWVLMGPVSMLKVGLGPFGVIIFVLLALLVWLWSVLLFALALAETYDMTPDRVIVVLATPFAMSLVLLGWLFGFVEQVRQLAFHG
jgi:hypothetical protein